MLGIRITLIALVLVAGSYDLRFRRIPNWVSVSGIVSGFALNGFLLGMSGLKASVLGMLLALCIYVPLYALRGMGAGDVKLMAAVGAIAGPKQWFLIFVATALIGGLLGLTFVILKKRTLGTLQNLAVIFGELGRGRLPAMKDARLDFRHPDSISLPHGTVIALGSLAFLILNGTS